MKKFVLTVPGSFLNSAVLKGALFLFVCSLALLSLEGCASKNSSLRIGEKTWAQKGWSLQVPVPEPVVMMLPVERQEDWGYKVEAFSRKDNFFRVKFVMGKDMNDPVMQFDVRGMNLDVVRKDTTFKIPVGASDSTIVMNFLKWDADYSLANYDMLYGGKIVSSFWSDAGFGMLCLKGDEDYQECNAAKLTPSKNLYVVMVWNYNPMDNPEKYVYETMKSFDYYKP